VRGTRRADDDLTLLRRKHGRNTSNIFSVPFSDDPRSLEELVKDHYAGVQDNDRNVGAIWQELDRQKSVAIPLSFSAPTTGSSERYKLIHFFVAPEEFELYDLQVDPEERKNLYGRPEYGRISCELKQRLAALRAHTNDTYEYKPTGMPLHFDLGVSTESGLVPQKK